LANDYFDFKQFTIKQENCAMKVGTDGVLLGAWTNPEDTVNILDVGTGTGLIAIMLAQKSKAQVDAIEIDGNAYNQALVNVGHCPWNQRIRIIHTSFQDFCKHKDKRYDLIVTNPPFFSNSLKAAHEGRNLARHNEMLPPGELLSGVDQLLMPSGRFCLILPKVDSQTFIIEAAMYNLYCMRKTNIKPLCSKKIYRVLMELAHQRYHMIEDDLVIQNELGDYSEEYKLLTRDFYLNF
jgi:tRNA1Val (adenine37-N6)-methyltransferase